jgi:hypothetical protein
MRENYFGIAKALAFQARVFRWLLIGQTIVLCGILALLGLNLFCILGTKPLLIRALNLIAYPINLALSVSFARSWLATRGALRGISKRREEVELERIARL